MKMLEVQARLEDLRLAREKWGRARTEFFSGYDWVLTRLVHEGARNYMTISQMAVALGVKPATIRAKMRQIGLDPRAGKRVLSKTASEALLDNAAIMGIDPSEMDLTSPLAYLPMGAAMKRAYQDKTLGVTEWDADELDGDDPPVSRNTDRTKVLAALRENGRALLSVDGAIYDIRAEYIPNFTRPLLSLDNVELLLTGIAPWETPVVHGINYVDDALGCGHLAYNDPVLITSDLDKITCKHCRVVLVRA